MLHADICVYEKFQRHFNNIWPLFLFYYLLKFNQFKIKRSRIILMKTVDTKKPPKSLGLWKIFQEGAG